LYDSLITELVIGGMLEERGIKEEIELEGM